MLDAALIVGAIVFAIAVLAAPRILRQHNAPPRIARIVGTSLGVAFLACYLTWKWSRHFVGKNDPIVILAMCWVMFRTVPRKYLAAPLMLYLTDTALGIVGQERLFHLPAPYHALGDHFGVVDSALVIAWAGCFIPFLLKYHHALFDEAK